MNETSFNKKMSATRRRNTHRGERRKNGWNAGRCVGRRIAAIHRKGRVESKCYSKTAVFPCRKEQYVVAME